jgi:hypothetical protein
MIRTSAHLATAALAATTLATTLAAATLAGSTAGCGPAVTHTHASIVFASPATPDLTSRAAAAVRLRVQDASVSLTRSGVIVDPRGYVLTTFSAVGITAARARGGRPGTLYGGGDEVRVEIFDGPFSSTPTEHVGRVVRGDLRLNLALVRITGTADGPLPPEQRFPAIELPEEAALAWGGFGWAIGASPAVPTLTAFHANTTAGIHNSEGQLAGYLVNIVEPSLDGAGYYDGAGSFVGIYMNGFVRPVGRFPRAWREALAAGPIDDRVIDGVVPLVPGQWAEVSPIGDGVFVVGEDESRTDATEELLFAVPANVAGTVEVEPPVSIVAYQRGRALQTGNGEIFVPAEPDVFVAVRMPRPDDPRGLRVRVRFTPER